MRGIASCTPAASNFLSLQDLKSFSEIYNIPTEPNLEIEVRLIKALPKGTIGDSLASFRNYLYSCKPAYHTLHELAQIALTIAVTSVESERSFSALKRIKTCLRSRMAEDRLSALATLSIEREIAESLDYELIINEFGSADINRRIVLS
uniref:HAT C-terminal dimerisation domain-containing protein n=1 Tax=Amphimedon queenslandica TaxID=400682 RepID=A0A1X7TJC3_AMPQE